MKIEYILLLIALASLLLLYLVAYIFPELANLIPFLILIGGGCILTGAIISTHKDTSMIFNYDKKHAPKRPERNKNPWEE